MNLKHDSSALSVVVVGAGAWGTALAQHAAQRHSVVLYSRSNEHVAAMQTQHATGRFNEKYLPGIALSPNIEVTANLSLAIERARGGLLILGTAVAGLRTSLQQIKVLLQQRQRMDAPAAPQAMVWLSKGIEHSSELLPSQIVTQVMAQDRAQDRAQDPTEQLLDAGPLFGPSFAQEVAQGLPASLVVASTSVALKQLSLHALHHHNLRLYGSDDVLGVELGGALKNVVALAAGAADGLQLGMNARAALVTRGLAEITRLGVRMGANPQTFIGLTGVGDLMLTCTGALSRNRKVGVLLAQGQTLAQVLEELGHVAEGVACAQAAQRLAKQHGIEMPIVDAVCRVLFEGQNPRLAVAQLLAREPRDERG